MRQHGGNSCSYLISETYARTGPFPPSSPFPLSTPSFELWMNFSGTIINATYISSIHSPLIRRCLTRNGCVEGNPKIAPMRSVITAARNFKIYIQDIYSRCIFFSLTSDVAFQFSHAQYEEQTNTSVRNVTTVRGVVVRGNSEIVGSSWKNDDPLRKKILPPLRLFHKRFKIRWINYHPPCLSLIPLPPAPLPPVNSEKQRRRSGILKKRTMEGGEGARGRRVGGFEIPRSPRTCSFRALFPSHPVPSFLPAPLCLTPGALCIRISSGTSTWRSPLPSPAKWKCIKRSARPRPPPPPRRVTKPTKNKGSRVNAATNLLRLHDCIGKNVSVAFAKRSPCGGI